MYYVLPCVEYALVIRSQPDIVSKGEVELLKEMKDLAVVKVVTSARRAQLLASKQAPGETISCLLYTSPSPRD